MITEERLTELKDLANHEVGATNRYLTGWVAAVRDLLAERDKLLAKHKEFHGRAQMAEAAMVDMRRCCEKLDSGDAWVGGSLGRALLAYHNSQLAAERDNLLAFKTYVHKRLDDAGVSVDPDGPHKAEGCRIGGRLDELIGQRDALEENYAAFRAQSDERLAKVQAAFARACAERDAYRERVAALEAALRPLVSGGHHA